MEDAEDEGEVIHLDMSTLVDDGRPTRTSKQQRDAEALVLGAWEESVGAFRGDEVRAKTRAFVESVLDGPLPGGYASLDSSRPWLVYWTTHAHVLLGGALGEQMRQRCVDTLGRCQDALQGGFGGGPQQMPHTAPTYAAVMALATLGGAEAYAVVNRPHLYRFFLSLKDPTSGAFRVQIDGECDTRATYTVLAVASLTNMLTPQLTRGCGDWLRAGQGFDGGMGGEPGNESHAGYAYCAMASLVILGEASTIDLDAFARWLAQRQLALEGGFQGRTQKLVDSCYSFWVGACFALLERAAWEEFTRKPVGERGSAPRAFPGPDRAKLRKYVLEACAHPSGGFQDKPKTGRDAYHTCYSMSGLSVLRAGGSDFSLLQTDPVFNVEVERLGRAKAWFAKRPSSHAELLS